MRSGNWLRRKAGGFTIVETTIASACTLLLLGMAIPALTSAGDAGDQGATRVRVDSDTRHALMRLARELENTSSGATDAAGNPRLTIVDGLDPEPWISGNGDMGGFEGTLGDNSPLETRENTDVANDVITGTAVDPGTAGANETGAKGSGARGSTMWGRKRSADLVGTAAISLNSGRPRHAVIAKNSILTFQKVLSYTIDGTGAPVVTWTTPIEYRVINKKLIRTQDGKSTVACPVCVGFRAEISDAGTVIVTIVSQGRTHGNGGRVMAGANQIEVGPKN